MSCSEINAGNGSFDTPVLLLVFNRPETTIQVFEAIRAMRPRQLFVSADGPRENPASDRENCAAVRSIVQKIDWECDVQYRFLEKNHGSRYAVAGAIDWFFSHVEQGIVLEDDCLPSPDFFIFCSAVLEHYRNDERIMHVNGTVFAAPQYPEHDVWFSRYPLVWGWASWRRAWQKYQKDLSAYPFEVLDSVFKERRARARWRELFEKVRSDAPGFDNAWDFQWSATLFANSALAISPRINLVENLGIKNGTHDISGKLYRALPEKPCFTSGQFSRPDEISPDEYADRRLFKLIFRKSPLLLRIMKKLQNLLCR